jgi:two-component system, NarL family, response regulator DesR
MRAVTGNDPRGTRTIRVVLADDESLFVEALAALLDLDERIDVVGRARDGLEALRLVATARPDVVLMDLDMPRINGIGAARILASEYPFVRVVIVTGSIVPEDLERAREAGAAAYVTKDRVHEELTDILAEVASETEELSPLPWGQGIPDAAVSRTAASHRGSP